MSHDPLDALRARLAQTQRPRDASDVISALLQRGELVTISHDASRERDYGPLASRYEDRGHTHIGQGVASGIGIWRHDVFISLMPTGHYSTYHLEWDLLGWQITSRTSERLLWEHDEPAPEDDFDEYWVHTDTPIEQVCDGRLMAIPTYMIELPDAQTHKADIIRHPISVPSLRPDLDLEADRDRYAADFGELLLPDFQALARPNVAQKARYGTLRLLATLLFGANSIRPRDTKLTTLEPHGDSHFTLSCAYDGLVSMEMDTSKIEYEARLDLTVTPHGWSFTRTVTHRDIYFGLALS